MKRDFSLVSILNGNDYLPKLGFTKLENIWEAYYLTKQNDNTWLIKNNTFDKVFFKKLINNIINTLPVQYKKFNIKLFEKHKVEQYLQGLLWCLVMYETTNCPMYDYIFEYDKSVSPTDILHYIDNYEFNITCPMSYTLPLNTKVCAVLLLPYSLLKKQYAHLIKEEFKYLYEQELCKICIDYKNNKNKDIKDHKDHVLINHSVFSINDINHVVNVLT